MKDGRNIFKNHVIFVENSVLNIVFTNYSKTDTI